MFLCLPSFFIFLWFHKLLAMVLRLLWCNLQFLIGLTLLWNLTNFLLSLRSWTKVLFQSGIWIHVWVFVLDVLLKLRSQNGICRKKTSINVASLLYVLCPSTTNATWSFVYESTPSLALPLVVVNILWECELLLLGKRLVHLSKVKRNCCTLIKTTFQLQKPFPMLLSILCLWTHIFALVCWHLQIIYLLVVMCWYFAFWPTLNVCDNNLLTWIKIAMLRISITMLGDVISLCFHNKCISCCSWVRISFVYVCLVLRLYEIALRLNWSAMNYRLYLLKWFWNEPKFGLSWITN